jgi:hypothetical protein
VRARGGVGRWLCAAAFTALAACTHPPPSHALIVRHPERKCALVWFPSCAALLGPRANAAADADAGVE